MVLGLGADELLSTTRAVRDSARILTGRSNRVWSRSASGWHTGHHRRPTVRWPTSSLCATRRRRAALADIWRRGRAVSAELPIAWRNYRYDDPDHAATTRAMVTSAQYLADNLAPVPVMVVPCVTVRTDTADVLLQSLVWGAVLPAAPSFCLAARERGLGTCWTTIHAAHENEAAEVLGIPYPDVMQTALIPVAHTSAPISTRPVGSRWSESCMGQIVGREIRR
jgi:nitroreductase